MKIKIPPLELQAQFAQIVKKTEALKTQYQQSLQELENLYGSLSQRAFTGELGLNYEVKEKALMVVDSVSTIKKSTIPEKKRGFAKQVLGGKIVLLFKDDKNFTHISSFKNCNT